MSGCESVLSISPVTERPGSRTVIQGRRRQEVEDEPDELIRFIGLCEVLGALGLILPGETGVRRELTPLAAAGLVVIMVGATVSTLAIGGGVVALPTLLLGLLAAALVVGRRQAHSFPRVESTPRLQPASESLGSRGARRALLTLLFSQHHAVCD